MRHNPDIEALAPSIEARWREAFIVELRLQGASGRRIADALAEMQTHCRESGQGAADAFGPAVHYASALDLPDESRRTPAQLVATWVALLLLVGGVGASLASTVDVVRGQRTEISVGLLVSYGASIIVMAIVFAAGGRLLRFALSHPVWSMISVALAMAAVPLVGLPFKGVSAGSVPAGPTLVAGVAAIAVAIAITLVATRRGNGLADPLTPPLAGS